MSNFLFSVLYEKEEAQLRIMYPVIVSVVVILTGALIVVIVWYWRRARFVSDKLKSSDVFYFQIKK